MNKQMDDDFLYANVPQVENILLSKIPDEADLKHSFSKKFQKKMKRLLKYEKRSPFMRKAVIYCQRIAAAFLIVLSLTFLTTMSVEAYRTRFFNFVTTVWDEFTSIFISSEQNSESDKLIPIDPSYLPVGYTEGQKTVDDFENTIIFKTLEGDEIYYSQRLLSQSEIIFDSENAEIDKLILQNTEINIIRNKGIVQLYWFDDPSLYLLEGKAESELINMAKSIIFE